MAKKRKDKSDRVIPIDASRRLAPTVYLPSIPKSSLSDLRFYQPYKPKVSYDEVGRRAKILQSPVVRRPARPTKNRSLSNLSGVFQEPFRERLSFAVPRAALVCVRRKQRREVLFANRKNKSGRGSKRRRNIFSDVRC